jgi:FkbM family methyltransferase
MMDMNTGLATPDPLQLPNGNCTNRVSRLRARCTLKKRCLRSRFDMADPSKNTTSSGTPLDPLKRIGSRLRKLARLLGHRRYWKPLSGGVAAAVEHTDVPFRRDHLTVLDVGASHGQFALFAEVRFPAAQILSFEPLPGPASALRRVTGSRVRVETVALGSAPGQAEINVSARDDSSSLLPIGERQVREFPGTAKQSTVTIEVSTLDSAVTGPVARPCLLKVDVQGLELEVLKGGRETLREVDEALVECSFVELYEGQALADEVIAFMLESGLRLAGVFGTVFSKAGEPVQADFLFRRTEPDQ